LDRIRPNWSDLDSDSNFMLYRNHALFSNASLSEIAKRWGRDVAGCRREWGACESGVHGLVIARTMVPGHLWMIMWEREELSSGSKGGDVRIDKPLAVLTPRACQALFWAAGGLQGRSSEVLG
jgi:hypothetical protein